MKIFNFKTASDFASASGADGCCTMHMAAIISILITAVIIVDKQKVQAGFILRPLCACEVSQ